MMTFKQKLNGMFKALRQQGYFARQNWQCCQGCGWAAIEDGKDKMTVFYHRQDAEGLEEREEVYLAWHGNAGVIIQSAIDAGLTTEWDGKNSTRILVKERRA